MAKYSVSYIYQIVDKYSAQIDKIKRKTKEAAAAADRAKAKFAGFGKKLTEIGGKATLALTVPLVLLGKHMIQAASDAEETRNKYATVFKELGIGAEETADKFAKSYGLAGTTARQLLGDTGDMLTGFGFASEEALKLSTRVNELAVDLASFTNFSGGAEGASAALTKALLGERESVKSLGIAILEEDVKKKVAQMRSDGMRFATEREAKAYATLEIAISQSKNAIGDYARTKMSFANVQRRVSQNNKELAEVFGRVMIPMATKALLVIEKLQQKFMGLDDRTKKIIVTVAGFAAVIGPLLLLIGGIAMIIPVVVAGLSAMGAALPVIALGAILGLAIKLGGVLVELAVIVGSNVVNAFKSAFEWISAKFQMIMEFLSKIKAIGGVLFKGAIEGISNPATSAASISNTVSGKIDITANNATVNQADFSINDNNLGTTVAAPIR